MHSICPITKLKYLEAQIYLILSKETFILQVILQVTY